MSGASMDSGSRFANEPDDAKKESAIRGSEFSKKYSLVCIEGNESLKFEFTVPSSIAEEDAWTEFVSDLGMDAGVLLLGRPRWFSKPGSSFILDSNQIKEQFKAIEQSEITELGEILAVYLAADIFNS